MGPVEDFRTGSSSLGYDEAAAGDVFYRIGMGAVKKPDDKPFQPFRTYEIVDPGKWSVDKRADSITFVQELTGKNGYAWRYTKTVRLVEGKPEMVIAHELKNTGSKPLQTQQYNHNFFVIDGKPTGPGVSVAFPFDLKPVRSFPAGSPASVQGSKIQYASELQGRESAYAEFEGAPEYGVQLEHAKAGAGVKIKGDKPIQKLVFWSIRSTFCPEPYIDVSAEPGRESRWNYTYSFYPLK